MNDCIHRTPRRDDHGKRGCWRFARDRREPLQSNSHAGDAILAAGVRDPGKLHFLCRTAGMANATDDIARQLRTGQIRAADINEDQPQGEDLRPARNHGRRGLPGLVVDLREFATFAEAAAVRIKLTADKDLDTTGFESARSVHVQEHAPGLLQVAGDDRFHAQVDVESQGRQDAAFRDRNLAERAVRRLKAASRLERQQERQENVFRAGAHWRPALRA